MALTRVRQQQVNTTVTGIDDPVIPINAAQTGENTQDIGFIFNRGSLENAAIIWDEGVDTFKLILTTADGDTNSTTGNVLPANLILGSVTGSLIGNADTASKLATPVNINGVPFDGSQNITIATGAGGTSEAILLQGNTLSPNVVYSSLTSVGTLSNLTVNSAPTYGAAGLLASFASTVDGYNQLILQNKSDTTSASTSFVVSNDAATDSTNYGEIGMNSSNWNTNGAFGKAGTVYLGSASTDLAIGTYGPKPIHFVANGSLTDALTIHANNVSQFSQTVLGDIAGNAATATKLQTARLINGVSFDGTANITVTANASTLTGTSLNSTVTSSSLTTVGNLTTLHVDGLTTVRGNLDMQSAPTIGITLDNQHAWKDLIGDVAPKTGNALAASLKQFQGDVYGWAHTSSSVGDLIYHLPHDYAPGTDLHLHVHWGHNGTAITGSFIVKFYVSYAKRTYPATPFSSPVVATLTVNSLNMTNSPRYCHRVDEIQLSQIGGSANLLNTSDIEVDGVISIHYAIDTVPSINGSDFSNLPYIQTIDIHMQSTGIGTSRKDPGYYT